MRPTLAKLFNLPNARPDLGEVHGINMKNGREMPRQAPPAEPVQRVLTLPVIDQSKPQGARWGPLNGSDGALIPRSSLTLVAGQRFSMASPRFQYHKVSSRSVMS